MVSVSGFLLKRRSKYVQEEGEYRIYAIFSDLGGDPSSVVEHPLPLIPEQTEHEIDEYGANQLIIHFNDDDTCILSVEGVTEDDSGENYQVYYQKPLTVDEVRPVIENVAHHTKWYDDHGLPM